MAFREIPVDQGLFNELVSSNSTRVLARGSWLPHIAQMPDVLQVWGWSDTSTKAAQRVIRSLGPNSSGFKQDEWCLVKRRDGSVVATGPYKDVDGDHHTDTLHGWPIRRSDSAQS